MVTITCNAVGDILALATLVIDVARALNDARGSSSEYRAFIDDLDAVHTMLVSVSRVAEDSVDDALRDQIVRKVDQCGREIQKALERIANFSALGDAGTASDGLRVKFKRNWHKVEWRFLRRDETQNVRKELAMATQHLTTLLVISNANGATRFRGRLLRGFDDLVAQNATLSRIINSNTAILRDTRTITRNNRVHVKELFSSVPEGVDSKTAAVAVLCAAVCTMHGPYNRALPTALLLVAIYILSRSSGQHARALVHDVAYSRTNAVTLLDALDRQFILPFELCETYALFHATLVNLFSQQNGRWFVDERRYTIRLPRSYEIIDSRDWHQVVKPGAEVEMAVVVQQVPFWQPHRVSSVLLCPVCATQPVARRHGLDYRQAACHACGRSFVNRHIEQGYVPRTSGGIGTVDDLGRFPRARPQTSSNSLAPSSTNPENVSVGTRQDVQSTLSWEAQVHGFSRIEIHMVDTAWDFCANLYMDISFQDHRGLLTAAQNAHHELAIALLAEGVDVNSKNHSGHTALHIAAIHGHIDMVRLLLDNGAAIDAATEDGFTPLALAMLGRQHAITSLLLDQGALVDAPKPLLSAALYAAVQIKDGDVAETLLKLGADANMYLPQFPYKTPLHAAASHCSGAFVKKLIQYEANAEARSDLDVDTPMLVAALQGNSDAFMALFAESRVGRAGVDDALSLSSNYDLHAHLLRNALIGDRLDILQMVLQTRSSVDFNAPFADGATPLAVVSRYGFDEGSEVVEFLLSQGADPNVEAMMELSGTIGRPVSCTALHAAACEGHAIVVDLLLDGGANIDARTQDGDTPLSLALKALRDQKYNYVNHTVDLLLSRGAEIDERSSSLFRGLASGQPNDYVVSRREHDEGTALHSLASGGFRSVVEVLLQYGADMNARTTVSEATPLLLALKGRYGPPYIPRARDSTCPEVVKLLLSRGAVRDEQSSAILQQLTNPAEWSDPGPFDPHAACSSHGLRPLPLQYR